MDALLGSNKVCLLVQENSKTDLEFMRLEKYSSYIRLTSITELVSRFIENLKRKFSKDTSNLKPFVTTGEKIKAENLWIRFTQDDIIKSDNYK